MVDDETNGGPPGFWSTLPGIFTGIAAVITAVGGVYIAGRGMPPSPTATTMAVSTTTTTTTTETSVPVPASPGSVPISQLFPGEDIDPEEIAGVDWQTAVLESAADTCATTGDSSACTFLFDALANECYLGEMPSCDLLWELSPLDSEYEAYGGTCGYRVEVDYAGACSTGDGV